MNEQNAKRILILSMLILAIVFVIFFIYKQYIFAIVSVCLFFVVLMYFVLAELYLRVQHNIENNFRSLVDTKKELDIIKSSIVEETDKIKEDTAEVIRNIDIKSQENQNDLNLLEDKIIDLAQQIESTVQHNKKDISIIKNKVQDMLEQTVLAGRYRQLIDIAPKVFSHKTVLYIGARKDRYQFLANFFSAGYNISILEIHEPNADFFRTLPWVNDVITDDVRTFKSDNKYDIVFWWHGPEHISKEDLSDTLRNLESITNKMIVLGCPWGDVPRNDKYEKENVNEKHLNIIGIGDLESLGYKASYFGTENVLGSNIIAVKEM